MRRDTDCFEIQNKRGGEIHLKDQESGHGIDWYGSMEDHWPSHQRVTGSIRSQGHIAG